MNKISTLKIIDKKILKLSNKCNIISIICCLFSALFIHYFFQNFNHNIFILSLLLFEAGLSIKIGAFISSVIIQNCYLNN